MLEMWNMYYNMWQILIELIRLDFQSFWDCSYTDKTLSIENQSYTESIQKELTIFNQILIIFDLKNLRLLGLLLAHTQSTSSNMIGLVL